MPFVTDIVGPQRPVEAWPPLTAGMLRRTSTIDTHPAGTGAAEVDLRARDVVVTGPPTVEVLEQVAVRARLADRVIVDIAPDGPLAQLTGSRVGPGFRAHVATLFPDEVRRAGLLNLLLDDWVGAALVSGYGVQHAAIRHGVEEKLPAGTANRMAGICAGFAPDASMVSYARRHDIIPTARGPIAPPLDADGMHAVAPLRPDGMRRLRRLDLIPVDSSGDTADFDAHFRDSHVDDEGVETIVHEYTVTGSVDLATRTIASVAATVQVLPWQECPGAIGSATRVRGMRLAEVRDRVRGELVGTSTCTHLNDTLRALADLDALLSSRVRAR
ncbi:DUF2889 domain-containing protein [Mycolicibacterium sp. XJ1819]